jgi:hypothetical protein
MHRDVKPANMLVYRRSSASSVDTVVADRYR